MRLMGLAILAGLMACCQSDEPVPGTKVEVVSYVSSFDENFAVTRAWTPPTGYTPYAAGNKTIGICFTQDGTDPESDGIGFFFKGGSTWRTDLEITAGDYYLYGYAPHVAGITCQITDGDEVPDGEYSKGAILTLHNVPTLMMEDLCTVVGAKHGSGKETVVGLRRGDFKYSASSTETENYVFLLFDHLYAALDIHLRVHGDYHALRTIHLTDMHMQTCNDETPTKKKTDVKVTLAATEGESPIQSIIYTPTGTEEVDAEVFHSTGGVELGTDYQSYLSYFMPHGITKVILTCTYDVYDKKGNLVRRDCKASNTLDFNQLFDRFDMVRAGTHYNIYLTIRPTYLYMLSDPDLENPEMVVS